MSTDLPKKSGNGLEKLPSLAHLRNGVLLVLSKPSILLFLLVLSWLTALPATWLMGDSAERHLSRMVSSTAGNASTLEEASSPENNWNFRVGAPHWVFEDWQRSESGLQSLLENSLAPLMLLAGLLGLFVCGGWMNLAVRGHDESALGQFMRGGGRFFGRFLRTWILALLLFAGVTWLVWDYPGQAVRDVFLPAGDLRPESEATLRNVDRIQELVYFILILFIEVIVDVSRASIVVGHRRSACLSLLRGFGHFVAHPFRISLLLSVGYGLELVWLFGGAFLVQQLDLSLLWLAVWFPFGRIAFRGARFAGLAALYAEYRRSTTPDPEVEEATGAWDDGTAWRT